MLREQEIIAKADKIISKISNLQNKRDAYVHLHGVSEIARMIGYKRGLNSELLAVAGLLHDLFSYNKNQEKDHARYGSVYARKLLKESKLYKKSEIDTICNAIFYHSAKGIKHSKFDEALKDADVFQHYIMEPWKVITKPKMKHLKKVKREFGLHIKPKK